MKYNYINRWSYLFRDQKNSFALAPVASFVYDGNLLIEEHQFQPGPYGYDRTFSYLWDPTAGMASRPLMMLDYQNNSFFYTHDANKNVTELVDDSGKIVTHYEYSPFGALTVSTASTANPFTFSSEYFDSSLGLIYYNYRHYNPLDGRWISRDPIEEEGGFNLYGMVNNNLVNQFDILGKISFPFEISYGHDLTWKRISGTLTISLDCSATPPTANVSLSPESFDAVLTDGNIRWRNNYDLTVEYSFENINVYLSEKKKCYNIYTVTYGIRKKITGIREYIQPNNIRTYFPIDEEWYTPGSATGIKCCP